MNKILLKKYLFLEGNRLLGALIFYEDSEGRPCLKLSIEHKIGQGDLWVEELKTEKQKSFLPTTPQEMSGDISYKFADNLLEIKTQVPGERPRPVMTEVPTPPKDYLFAIRLKDWEHLPIGLPDKDALILAPLWSCKEIVIFCSFAGVEGKPFMPEQGLMKNIEGRIFIVDLPLAQPYDKIWIGVGEDSGNRERHSMTIKAQNYRNLE
jgi:hypothetical protein